MKDERCTRLEENLTHLQRHVSEQDKVMLAPADEVSRLKQELAAVRTQLAAAAEPDAGTDERPPHY